MTRSASSRIARRSFNRLAAGTGALVGLAPRLGSAPRVAQAAAQPALITGIDRADSLGVNESFKAAAFGQLSGAGWTRWTVQWFNVQPNPGEFNVHYFRDNQGKSILEDEINAGMKVAAMVLGTPEWAAETPGLKTGTSVPKGLGEPVMLGDKPNPANTWGAFMFRLAQEYAGLMDVFEIWNEVEIPATGSNALYNTWAGTPAQYYQLLKVASEAAKAANPSARIVTSPYSYFKDKEEGGGKTLPFFDAFGEAVKADPAGASAFDAVALNLYRNPDDLWDRVRGGVPVLEEVADRTGMRARLQAIGAGGKPLWLTEINAMPYGDGMPEDGFRITLDEQASYVIQAHAIALCAGYEKVFWQALQDDPPPIPDEQWGLVRFNPDRMNADESRARPAFIAYQLVAKYMGNADSQQLLVTTRPDPRRYAMYASRFEWAQRLAVFQKGDQRAHIFWNGTAEPAQVTYNSWGVETVIIDKHGNERPATRNGNRVSVTLDPASRHFDLFGGDPPGYFYVGGSPLIVLDKGVPGNAPVEATNFRPA